MVQASRILLVTFALTIPIFSAQGQAAAQQLEEPPTPPPPDAPLEPQPPPPPPLSEPPVPRPPSFSDSAPPPPPPIPERMVLPPQQPDFGMGTRLVSPLPPRALSRWRAGRAVFAVGNIVGLVGSGLSFSGLVVVGIYGPGTDRGELGTKLIIGGAGTTVAGVILSATGLGLQHSALASIGADPGRGIFGVGTAFGVLGTLGLGASSFFRITREPGSDIVPSDLAFSISLASAVLLGVGSILYFADERRMVKVYRRLALPF